MAADEDEEVEPHSDHLDLDTAAVVVVSRQGRVEYWSPGATRLFGHPVEDVLGKKVSIIIPEEFRARHWQAWGAVWKTNEVPAPSPVMIPVLCADRTVRSFVAHLLPVHAPHGELLAVAAVWAAPSERDDGIRSLT